MPAAASPPCWKTSIVEILFSTTSVEDKFDFCHEKLFKFKAILFLIGEIMNSIIRSPHTEKIRPKLEIRVR